jgi:hypothetical protein
MSAFHREQPRYAFAFSLELDSRLRGNERKEFLPLVPAQGSPSRSRDGVPRKRGPRLSSHCDSTYTFHHRLTTGA